MKHCNLRQNDTLAPLPDGITACSTIDESGNEHEITEFMIRRACEQMDADQLWPYASHLYTGMRTVPSGGADILPFKRPQH